MQGCLAQYPKKILAYDLVKSYEKTCDKEISYFFRIRTDMFYTLTQDNIKNIINKNILNFNHDTFSFIPSCHLKSYCLDNFKYLIKERLENKPNCWYLNYFLDKNIEISGSGHVNQNSFQCFLKDNVKVRSIMLRKNANNERIGAILKNDQQMEVFRELNKDLKLENYSVLPQNKCGFTSFTDYNGIIEYTFRKYS